MRQTERCPRLLNETWRAPGGQGTGNGPHETRDMQGRCVEPDGHDGPHIYGDWVERSWAGWPRG